MKKRIVGVVACLLLFSFVFAGGLNFDANEKEKAKALATKAVAHAKLVGTDQAIIDWNENKSGEWMYGELYIFCVDTKGNTLVNLGNSKLVGKNVLELKDSKGKAFIKEFITIATSKTGEGVCQYYWSNPKTKRIDPKLSYVRAIDKNTFIGIGVYGRED
jgi:methyl-accepting chemotaxis protein